MTVNQLARLLAKHIAQGGGEHQMAVFQWQYESQLVTDLIHRPGCDYLEIYSGTVPTPTVESEPEDLLGSDEYDDLI